jgi:hypothetical protein
MFRNLARAEAECVRRARRPLFGSEFLCVAGNRGKQQRHDGCEGNASTAKTHSGLPGHPALLPLAAASSVAIRKRDDAAGWT